ncbi:MAG: hypothetical protein K2X31_03905 [Sphingopyxis sp.]|jgi:hypothetical protein|nr:hypothetical protein [Sphingopyxis sp.]
MMLDSMPLWLLGGVIFLVLLVALELGFRVHAIISRRDKPDTDRPDMDFLLSAAMGLLALLLGFTFSLALNRHEDRRELVIAEANAISTSWLRIQALDEPARAELAQLFRDYALARIAWSRAHDSDEGASEAALGQSTALQPQIWASARDALRTSRGVVDAKTLLDPINESFDLATERIIQREAQIPNEILAILGLYLLVSTAMIGWRLDGAGRRLPVASAMTVALLSLAAVAIIDLDHARAGGITVSQKAMRDLVPMLEPIP